MLGLVGDKFPYPDGLSDDEIAQLEAVRAEYAAERGYLEMQNHRPDTIGAALTDSPVGQLAWIAEKFKTRTSGGYRTPDESVDRDQLLTNISLYWFTRSGASSAQFYYESEHSGLDAGHGRRRAVRMGRVRHPPAHAPRDGPVERDRPLERVRRGRSLPRDGGAEAARGRHPRLLPRHFLTRSISEGDCRLGMDLTVASPRAAAATAAPDSGSSSVLCTWQCRLHGAVCSICG